MQPVVDELSAQYGASVTTLTLDTSSLASVRAAVTQFRTMLVSREVSELDAIVCNAGGRFDGDVSYSPDGYEMTFATNCLGHFLLVELLFPSLSEKGRVVYTASGTHDWDSTDGRLVGATVEPDAAALATNGKDGGKALSAGKRYSTSKLCTVMYAYELDRRLRRSRSSVSSIAFDPGSVPETGFLRDMPRPVQWVSNTAAMKWVSKRMGAVTSDAEFFRSRAGNTRRRPRLCAGIRQILPGPGQVPFGRALRAPLLRRTARSSAVGRHQASRPPD
ncbi:SDR family NAD(P)-dependent oxidoreductase [Saccharopolyspora gregorii]|uniref:SDR family NAD(P)-dependent oxidoreductase n=1 Tax=Saccharopolyspora gregorii TaxID=33914 RepID=A0ABP6RW78_9PSEU